MRNRFFVVGIFFAFLSTASLQGQQVTLTIKDAKSGETVPFANLVIIALNDGTEQYGVADKQGEATLSLSAPSLLTVSSIGYVSLKDTIYPGSSYTLMLQPQIFDLDEVVVTGSAVPRKVDQSIYNIKVLSRREIELKGATDMTDLLSKELNIRINQDAVLGSGLTIRGLSGNNVKILMNGVPVVGRLGGNIDLSQIDVQNIDHVEMVEGPMSTIYGSNALAGVINIITRDPEKERWQGGINTYYESVGMYNTDARFSFRKKHQFIQANGGRHFFSGFSVNDSLRSQLWKPKELYTGDFLYGFNSKNVELRLQSSLMHEKLLMRGDLLPPYYEKAFDSWFYTFRATNRLQAHITFSDHFSVQSLFSYNDYTRRKETWFKDLTTLDQVLSGNTEDHDTSGFNSIIFRTISEYTLNNGILLQAGVDVQTEGGKGKRIDQGSQEIDDVAFFVSGRLPVFAGVEIQPGLRASYNSDFKVPLVPSLNVKWTPLRKLNFRFSFARGYRAPSLKELFIYFVDINHNILPNTNLLPENGNSFNLTTELNTELRQKTHFSTYKLDLFYNNLSNIIKLAKRPLDNQLVYQYVNINYYRTVGGSFQFRYHFYPNFRFSLGLGTTGTSYAFTKDNNDLSDYSYSKDLNSSAEWNFRKPGITLSAYYKYTGNAILFEIDEDNNIQRGTMADYHTLDITIQKRLFHDKMKLSVGGKNLFNNTNIETTGNISTGVHSSGDGNAPVGWGRTWFVRMDYSFGKK